MPGEVCVQVPGEGRMLVTACSGCSGSGISLGQGKMWNASLMGSSLQQLQWAAALCILAAFTCY